MSIAYDSVATLRSAVSGPVIGPGDKDYDEVRKVYIEGIDRRPAAIIRVEHAEDVSRVVRLAAESGVELSVRSGGHSIAGLSVADGGWVVDLSRLKGLEIDLGRQRAWAGTGLRVGEFTAAVGAEGLATPLGDTPGVGLGGLTLGGGVGFLHRKLGLTIDNVLAAQVVTADGRILHVDADSHPDLFWALRGGGGSFGVVTRIEYRLHRIEPVVGGMLMLPADPDVLSGVLAAAIDAPDELSGVIAVMKAPPMPFVPTEHHGKPVVLATLVLAGRAESGERALASIRSLASPIIDTIQPTAYSRLFESEEGGPHHTAIAFRSFYMDRVDRTDAERVLQRVTERSDAMRFAQFRVLGGAVARVPVEATAFAHRDRRVMAGVGSSFGSYVDAERHEAWVDSVVAELRQGTPGAFSSFLSRPGQWAREAYPGETGDRLVDVKARYDPRDLFRSTVPT